jgi:hypothetical protein
MRLTGLPKAYKPIEYKHGGCDRQQANYPPQPNSALPSRERYQTNAYFHHHQEQYADTCVSRKVSTPRCSRAVHGDRDGHGRHDVGSDYSHVRTYISSVNTLSPEHLSKLLIAKLVLCLDLRRTS